MSEVAEKRSRRGGGRDARRTLRSGGATQLSTPYLVRHVPLYEIAGIPAIDIIDFDYPNEKTKYHHTQKDIVANCSPEGLSQVGTLMVHHIYEQK